MSHPKEAPSSIREAALTNPFERIDKHRKYQLLTALGGMATPLALATSAGAGIGVTATVGLCTSAALTAAAAHLQERRSGGRIKEAYDRQAEIREENDLPVDIHEGRDGETIVRLYSEGVNDVKEFVERFSTETDKLVLFLPHHIEEGGADRFGDVIDGSDFPKLLSAHSGRNTVDKADAQRQLLIGSPETLQDAALLELFKTPDQVVNNQWLYGIINNERLEVLNTIFEAADDPYEKQEYRQQQQDLLVRMLERELHAGAEPSVHRDRSTGRIIKKPVSGVHVERPTNGGDFTVVHETFPDEQMPAGQRAATKETKSLLSHMGTSNSSDLLMKVKEMQRHGNGQLRHYAAAALLYSLEDDIRAPEEDSKWKSSTLFERRHHSSVSEKMSLRSSVFAKTIGGIALGALVGLGASHSIAKIEENIPPEERSSVEVAAVTTRETIADGLQVVDRYLTAVQERLALTAGLNIPQGPNSNPYAGEHSSFGDVRVDEQPTALYTITAHKELTSDYWYTNLYNRVSTFEAYDAHPFESGGLYSSYTLEEDAFEPVEAMPIESSDPNIAATVSVPLSSSVVNLPVLYGYEIVAVRMVAVDGEVLDSISTRIEQRPQSGLTRINYGEQDGMRRFAESGNTIEYDIRPIGKPLPGSRIVPGAEFSLGGSGEALYEMQGAEQIRRAALTALDLDYSATDEEIFATIQGKEYSYRPFEDLDPTVGSTDELSLHEAFTAIASAYGEADMANCNVAALLTILATKGVITTPEGEELDLVLASGYRDVNGDNILASNESHMWTEAHNRSDDSTPGEILDNTPVGFIEALDAPREPFNPSTDQVLTALKGILGAAGATYVWRRRNILEKDMHVAAEGSAATLVEDPEVRLGRDLFYYDGFSNGSPSGFSEIASRVVANGTVINLEALPEINQETVRRLEESYGDNMDAWPALRGLTKLRQAQRLHSTVKEWEL